MSNSDINVFQPLLNHLNCWLRNIPCFSHPFVVFNTVPNMVLCACINYSNKKQYLSLIVKNLSQRLSPNTNSNKKCSEKSFAKTHKSNVFARIYSIFLIRISIKFDRLGLRLGVPIAISKKNWKKNLLSFSLRHER